MKYIMATPPPKLRDQKLYGIALVYAGVIVLALLGQLFRFDHIITAVSETAMFGGVLGVSFWTVLVVVELFSLPFLLRLSVSPLMRFVSLVASFLTPILWAMIVAWQLSNTTAALGLFGTEVGQLNVWGLTMGMTLLGLVGASAAVASLGTFRQVRTALRK